MSLSPSICRAITSSNSSLCTNLQLDLLNFNETSQKVIDELLEAFRTNGDSSLVESDIGNLISDGGIVEEGAGSGDDNGYRPFNPSFNVKLLWSLCFGLMVAAAIFGNVAVIYIILKNRSMRSKTNLFLLNLSIADLLMATFNTLFNFAFMINSDWPFGSFYCAFNNFVSSLAVSASVSTITATSVDRYMAVMHPIARRLTLRKTLICIAVIWTFAALLSLPAILFTTTLRYEYAEGQTRTMCVLQWPDGLPGESLYDYVYNLIFFAVTYAIPMLCMAYTYIKMGVFLWGSQAVGEVTVGQREAVRSKQRVVPMLVTVTIVFAICWLPYHVYFLVTYHWPQITQIGYIQHVYLAIYWLGMSNAAFNPIIYCLLSQRFRRCFKAIFCGGAALSHVTTPSVMDGHTAVSHVSPHAHRQPRENGHAPLTEAVTQV